MNRSPLAIAHRINMSSAEVQLLAGLFEKYGRPAYYRLIRQLLAADDFVATRIANVLEGCSEATPCLSGACPLCGTRLQVKTHSLLTATVCVAAESMRGRLSTGTIVPASGFVAPGQLTTDTFHAVMESIANALAANSLTPCIIGLDVSLNEDREGLIPTVWSAHTASIWADWTAETTKENLKATFPASEHCRRPVEIDQLDKNAAGRLYPFKPRRERRQSYIDVGSEHRKPHRNTRGKPLRRDEAVELAKIEHAFGLRRRVHTLGINDNIVEQAFGGFNWPRDGPD